MKDAVLLRAEFQCNVSLLVYSIIFHPQCPILLNHHWLYFISNALHYDIISKLDLIGSSSICIVLIYIMASTENKLLLVLDVLEHSVHTITSHPAVYLLVEVSTRWKWDPLIGWFCQRSEQAACFPYIRWQWSIHAVYLLRNWTSGKLTASTTLGAVRIRARPLITGTPTASAQPKSPWVGVELLTIMEHQMQQPSSNQGNSIILSLYLPLAAVMGTVWYDIPNVNKLENAVW